MLELIALFTLQEKTHYSQSRLFRTCTLAVLLDKDVLQELSTPPNEYIQFSRQYLVSYINICEMIQQ